MSSFNLDDFKHNTPHTLIAFIFYNIIFIQESLNTDISDQLMSIHLEFDLDIYIKIRQKSDEK